MRAALVLLALGSVSAFAWESTCTKYPNKTLDPDVLQTQSGMPCSPSAGPAAARERWVGALDEHRRLWEQTRGQAGPPALGVCHPHAHRLHRARAGRPRRQPAAPTLVPVAFDDAARVAYRSYSVGEFTQLPDFS